MIVQIDQIKTRIAIIQQIPKKFFREIESAGCFGNHLFPSWITLFDKSDLKSKFEAVYVAYKAISNKLDRDKIIVAFYDTNEIFKLCDNDPNIQIIALKDLHNTIQQPIYNLFLYLYNNAINIGAFQDFVRDDVKTAMQRFRNKNRVTVCPFCGLESFDILTGEARPSLDHWLYKATFPMASVNFNNLIPIGERCNRAPAKGQKNVLFGNGGRRIKAFHPYKPHNGITSSFIYIKEPESSQIDDADWSFNINPTNGTEREIFESWKSLFNIEDRYKDYFKTTVFLMWLNMFKEFIDDPSNELNHARTIKELKTNLGIWKASFQIKYVTGALLYRNFIDYLINSASDAYLFGVGRSLNNDFAYPEA